MLLLSTNLMPIKEKNTINYKYDHHCQILKDY